jgi:two-component system phosphate regulon sensor histidine kinase PhoR
MMANLRREFVANVSHELKTPLTSIRGYAETLLSGGLEDEPNRARFVETIRTQAERLEALVEDLLQLADLERPDAALDLKDWDASAIVRDLASSFEDLATRRGLRLEVEARPGIRVRADRKRIEQALRNLLDNAVKYTDSGVITARAERTSSAIRVSVSDTGRGIGPEHLPRLFERFYRAEQGRARALGGTGLGLAIVKHAIQLHGGRVGVDSKVGEGSSFWFEISPDGPHLRS